MKITIIGANSYIARNLIHRLRNQFSENLILKLYDIQDYHFDKEQDYQFVNVLNIESVKKIDFESDITYVFAGKTGTIQGFEEYKQFVDINEIGLLNILSVYLSNSSKSKIVFPSSRLVYKGQKYKLKEDAEKEFKTIYAVNKYACEQYLHLYNQMYQIPYVIFRICVPYGTMISNASSYGTAEFMLGRAQSGKDISLYGNGEIKRTFTHIQDLCDALITGALSKNCINDVYNIGGEDFSLNEIAKNVAKKYNVNVTYVKWPDEALKIETGDTVFDSSKFDMATNYKYKKEFSKYIQGE
jgi:UDP-glucose 4-epimerase